jgi:hypothetical protein
LDNLGADASRDTLTRVGQAVAGSHGAAILGDAASRLLRMRVSFVALLVRDKSVVRNEICNPHDEERCEAERLEAMRPKVASRGGRPPATVAGKAGPPNAWAE